MSELVATSILQWYKGHPGNRIMAALVVIDGMIYPAAYSVFRGWVWADGQSMNPDTIEMWAPFDGAPDYQSDTPVQL